MKVRGDIERVNLATSERWQRVAGEGESRLEPPAPPATPDWQKIEDLREEFFSQTKYGSHVLVQADKLTTAAYKAGTARAESELEKLRETLRIIKVDCRRALASSEFGPVINYLALCRNISDRVEAALSEKGSK